MFWSLLVLEGLHNYSSLKLDVSFSYTLYISTRTWCSVVFLHSNNQILCSFKSRNKASIFLLFLHDWYHGDFLASLCCKVGTTTCVLFLIGTFILRKEILLGTKSLMCSEREAERPALRHPRLDCVKQTNCKAPAEYHANVTLWNCNTAGLDERVRDAVLIIWSTSAHLLLELSALKWGDVVHYTSLLILPSLLLISILIHTLRWASCGLSTSALCTKGSKLEQPSAYWTRSYR